MKAKFFTKTKDCFISILTGMLVFLAIPGVSLGVTIDDIEILPMVVLEQVGHSANVVVNPVDLVPHVAWVKDGDIKHTYRLANGNWASAETVPDGGSFVFGGDEHNIPLRNVGMTFDDSGILHLVFIDQGGAVYYMYWNSGTWSSRQQVCNTANAKVFLDIEVFGTKKYVIYEEGVTDKLYYVVHNGSSWGSPQYIDVGEACSIYRSSTGYLYYLARGPIDPRNVYFGYIAPGGSNWTWVTGATDATVHMAGSPYLATYGTTIYVAYSDITGYGVGFKNTALYCARSQQPGTTWDHRFGQDTLFYADTGTPHPRMGVFSDGTLMYYNSRRDNEQVKVWDGVSWSDSLAAPWNDGESECAASGMTIWVAHHDNDNGNITVTGVVNHSSGSGSQTGAPDITAGQQVNGDNLKLTFSQIVGATSYNIYRGTSPAFTPDTQSGTNRIATGVTDQDLGTEGIQWTDLGSVVGDANTNYYYAVTAVGAGESAPSEIFGEFDYALVTTATTDFNEVAIPLENSTLGTALDLMNYIPYCNSVAYWDAASQGYQQYIPIVPATNFALQVGHPYYVNVTQNSTFTVTGTLSDPAFSLVTTATTDFNEIMLPLDKTTIATALDLKNDIPWCNSVARWDALIQGYEQFIEIVPSTNFATRIGYPYYVNVTANSTWPSGALLKNNPDDLVKSNSLTNLHVPHAVCSVLENNQDQSIHFRAWIEGNANDVLTESSPGCLLKNDVLMVQTAHFRKGWSIGEKMHLELTNKSGKVIATSSIILSDQAFDMLPDIVLAHVPEGYQLSQNYPNPFNPETLIKYSVPNDEHVSLNVYNTMGQHIRTLVNGNKTAGPYQVVWDGRNDAGLNVPSGMYFYVMKSGKFEKQLKAVLIR